MKQNIWISTIVASMIMMGCGSNNNDNSDVMVNTDANTTGMDENTTERFTKMTMMGDTVEMDNDTGLEWIGSAGNGACQPNENAGAEDGAVALAKEHCDALVFAGHDDWRASTAMENSKFIKDMKTAGKTPFYGNPACPRLIGTDGNTAMTVNTHNTNPIGETKPWGDFLNTSGMHNYGVKCVRKR
jgi:hypothetical protein